MKWIVDFIIRLAQRTPYTPIMHKDGRLYMSRWWLMPKFLLRWNPGFLASVETDAEPYFECNYWWPAIRVHHIATCDYDRHLHDHPFHFISIVLRGWYIEKRPVTVAPCFVTKRDHEATTTTMRKAGSIAFRHNTDRHTISDVSPGGVWTLVILWSKRQWWGFYTPRGKIYYRDYDKYKRWAAERWDEV